MMPNRPNVFGFVAWLLSRDDVVSTNSDISIAEPVFNELGELGGVEFRTVVESDVSYAWSDWADAGEHRAHMRMHIVEHEVAHGLYYEYVHSVRVQRGLVYAPLDGRDDWEDVVDRSVSAEEEDEEAAAMI